MCLDEIKAHSDDSDITEEHVLFLLKKYRSLLLKRQYITQKVFNTPSSNNTQTICISLEDYNNIEDSCIPSFRRSTVQIPNLLLENSLKVYPKDYSLGVNFTIVPKERFPFVGYNKYMKSIIYAYIDDNHYLCFDSSRPQTKYLEQVVVSGIFEDIDKAAELACSNSSNCDKLEQEFPLEDSLVPELIQGVVKELLGVAYRPKDNVNNAADDLSDLIAWARRNMKSAMQKQIEE